MPLGDAYVDAALDAVVDSWPSSGATYRLYASDPTLATTPSDVELAATGGYAPAAFSPSNWAPSADDSKATTAPVSFGTSTGAYSDLATYWGVVDSGGSLVYSDELTQSINVSAAGIAVAFTPALAFASGA